MNQYVQTSNREDKQINNVTYTNNESIMVNDNDSNQEECSRNDRNICKGISIEMEFEIEIDKE